MTEQDMIGAFIGGMIGALLLIGVISYILKCTLLRNNKYKHLLSVLIITIPACLLLPSNALMYGISAIVFILIYQNHKKTDIKP